VDTQKVGNIKTVIMLSLPGRHPCEITVERPIKEASSSVVQIVEEYFIKNPGGLSTLSSDWMDLNMTDEWELKYFCDAQDNAFNEILRGVATALAETQPMLDRQIIDHIRDQSDETVRLKAQDANAKTPLKYSFYSGTNRRRSKGRLSIQLSPERKGRRPSTYSGGGIKQPFDPAKFNYNKVFPHEIITETKIAGMDVNIITNVNPFAESHFLLTQVPQLKKELPLFSMSYEKSDAKLYTTF